MKTTQVRNKFKPCAIKVNQCTKKDKVKKHTFQLIHFEHKILIVFKIL